MFDELEKLRQAFIREIALAIKNDLPPAILKPLIESEQRFLAAYAALEKQAAEIVRQYVF